MQVPKDEKATQQSAESNVSNVTNAGGAGAKNLPTSTPTSAPPTHLVPTAVGQNLSARDRCLVGAAIFAQALGFGLMWMNRSNVDLVVVWEGGAIALATFLVGFTKTTKSVVWNCIFGVVNLVLVGTAWYLATRPH